jgi:hypothetical protein
MGSISLIKLVEYALLRFLVHAAAGVAYPHHREAFETSMSANFSIYPKFLL